MLLRSGSEGCSFGESPMVVERRWRRDCVLLLGSFAG
jgi:hypothetical protein